jgi:hypothetical protein
MWSLYPDIKPYKPYANHSLRVDDMHTVHIEECDNPQRSAFSQLPARGPPAWDESEINQDTYEYNFDQSISW